MQARIAPALVAHLLREDERVAHQRGLVRPVFEQERLVHERLDDDVRLAQPLGELERTLDVGQRLPRSGLRRTGAARLRRDRHDRGLVTFGLVRLQGLFERHDTFFDAVRDEEQLAEPHLGQAASARSPARRRMSIASSRSAAASSSRPPPTACSPAPRERTTSLSLVAGGSAARSCAAPPAGGQRSRPLGGAGRPAARFRAHVVAVGCGGVRLARVEVVRRDHLGDLVRVDAGVGRQEARRRESGGVGDRGGRWSRT